MCLTKLTRSLRDLHHQHHTWGRRRRAKQKLLEGESEKGRAPRGARPSELMSEYDFPAFWSSPNFGMFLSAEERVSVTASRRLPSESHRWLSRRF